jgi:hypothetical protein
MGSIYFTDLSAMFWVSPDLSIPVPLKPSDFGIKKSNEIREVTLRFSPPQDEVDPGPGPAPGPEETVSPGRVHGIDLPGG